jgi:uncharacterized protein
VIDQSTRVGDWLLTAHGRAFWPLDPRPGEVFIDDIAWALSSQCRFGGHCRVFYSIAEHSVRVADETARLIRFVGGSAEDIRGGALWGLLHDASEAYVVDVPRPLKRSSVMAAYRAIEAQVQAVICERFGLPIEEPAAVKEADAVLLATEARDLMAAPPMPWSAMPQPLSKTIVPWPIGYARWSFRDRFHVLAHGDGRMADCSRCQSDNSPTENR